jgi:hypothetical protein
MADEIPSELDDLKALRETLWEHLTLSAIPGSQKLGVGAIAGQLVKVIERIHMLEGATETKELTVADALAEARKRRTDGTAQTSRRGTKSAR